MSLAIPNSSKPQLPDSRRPSRRPSRRLHQRTTPQRERTMRPAGVPAVAHQPEHASRSTYWQCRGCVPCQQAAILEAIFLEQWRSDATLSPFWLCSGPAAQPLVQHVPGSSQRGVALLSLLAHCNCNGRRRATEVTERPCNEKQAQWWCCSSFSVLVDVRWLFCDFSPNSRLLARSALSCSRPPAPICCLRSVARRKADYMKTQRKGCSFSPGRETMGGRCA